MSAPPQSAYGVLGHQSEDRFHQGIRDAQSLGAVIVPPVPGGFDDDNSIHWHQAMSDQPVHLPFAQILHSKEPHLNLSPKNPNYVLQHGSHRPPNSTLMHTNFGGNRKRKQENGPNEDQARKTIRSHNDSDVQLGSVQGGKKPGYGYTLFFNNRDEALKGVAIPQWNAPQNDRTVPNTQAERQEWVRRLVRAFLDIRNCKDKPGPVFKKRWFDPEKPEDGYRNFYDRKAIEKMCWDIVDMVEKLHRHGPKTFSCYDPAFLKMVTKTQGLTFKNRMSKLILLFTQYKARCDKMFKSSIMETYVADPDTMLHTAQTNRGANDNRQEYIVEGRGGVKNKMAVEMGKWSEANRAVVSTNIHLAQNPRTYNETSDGFGQALYSTGNPQGMTAYDDHRSEDDEEEEDDIDDTSMEVDATEVGRYGQEGDDRIAGGNGDPDVESPNIGESLTFQLDQSNADPLEGATSYRQSSQMSHAWNREVDESYTDDEDEIDTSVTVAGTRNEGFDPADDEAHVTSSPASRQPGATPH
jgi:hypothetical protein